MRKNFAVAQHPSVESYSALAFVGGSTYPHRTPVSTPAKRKGKKEGILRSLPLFSAFSSGRALANASVNLQRRQMAEEEVDDDEFIWNL